MGISNGELPLAGQWTHVNCYRKNLRKISSVIIKVFYLSPVDISCPTGPSVNEREFVLGLLDRFNSSVHVILPRLSRQSILCSDKQNLSFLSTESKGSVFSYIKYEFEAFNTISKLIRLEREKKDVFILAARVTLWPLAVTLLSKCYCLPLVLRQTDVVEFDVIERRLPLPFFWFAQWTIKKIFGWCLRTATMIITVTQTISRRLSDEFNINSNMFRMVSNGVNHKVFKPRKRKMSREVLGLPNDKRLIGYIGGV